jgi:hypothetical protein
LRYELRESDSEIEEIEEELELIVEHHGYKCQYRVFLIPDDILDAIGWIHDASQAYRPEFIILRREKARQEASPEALNRVN